MAGIMLRNHRFLWSNTRSVLGVDYGGFASRRREACISYLTPED